MNTNAAAIASTVLAVLDSGYFLYLTPIPAKPGFDCFILPIQHYDGPIERRHDSALACLGQRRFRRTPRTDATRLRELRRVAAKLLRNERPGDSLQSADLVHEAYLRLMNAQDLDWQDRAHFFAIAATLMRRILLDRARRKAALKRRGKTQALDLTKTLDFAQVKTPARFLTVLTFANRTRCRRAAIATPARLHSTCTIPPESCRSSSGNGCG